MRTLQHGLTLIKSAKGSGKTESLIQEVKQHKRVLVVSHRRSLAKHISERLGLSCYLYRERWSREDLAGHQERYVICLDSLRQIRTEYFLLGGGVQAAPPYDLIIIDESEQFLAHFLSDTLERRKGGGRERLFYHFSHLVRKAKHVVALDADLGWVSYATLSRMKPGALVSVWLNDEAPTGSAAKACRRIQIYDSKPHLITEVRRAIQEGKRVFVTSNSKKLVERLSAAITKQCQEKRLIVVTSSTISQPDVIEFISDPGLRALEYDAIFTSPSLGTGVDFTFEGGAVGIDLVVGFFEPLVVTHFDGDQQIARVRNPGEIKVWISPQRFNFETSVDVIKFNLLEESLYSCVLTGYNENGAAIYNENTPLIDMAALIVSQQLASKNDLRSNFIRHKQKQGFEVHIVQKDADRSPDGNALLALGKKLDSETLIHNLMTAAPLPRKEFESIRRAQETDQPVAISERWSAERTRIELFYRQSISAELIKLDDRGEFRKRVRAFEEVTTKDRDLSHLMEAEYYFDEKFRYLRSDSFSHVIIIRMLGLTPLFKDGRFDAAFTITGSHLGPFAEFALENKAIVENVLGREVRADIRTKPVRQLNDVLDTIGLKLAKVGSLKAAGEKVYIYRLDREKLDTMHSIAQARRSQAWQSVAALHGWPAPVLEEDEEEHRLDDAD